MPAFSIREAVSYLPGRLTTQPDQRSGAIDLAGQLARAGLPSTGLTAPWLPVSNPQGFHARWVRGWSRLSG